MYQEEKLFEKMKSGEKMLVRFGATKTIGEYVIPKQVEKFCSCPNIMLKLRLTTQGICLTDLKGRT